MCVIRNIISDQFIHMLLHQYGSGQKYHSTYTNDAIWNIPQEKCIQRLTRNTRENLEYIRSVLNRLEASKRYQTAIQIQIQTQIVLLRPIR